MTTTFWSVGALLLVTAIVFLLVPVWLDRRRVGRWSPLGLLTTVAVAPAAIGIYWYVSDWDFELAARASESDQLVSALANRLAGAPDDLGGWALLANSYMALGRYTEARAAYRHLWTRTAAPDDELKLAYAEAEILVDRSALTGEPGRLVEDVLARRPNEPKALWYGGHFALAQGRNDLARTRWTTLLGYELPPEVEQRVRTELAALGGSAVAAARPEPTPAATTGPAIKLRVTLGLARSVAELGPNAQLFVIARTPEPGPPLAVIRQPPTAVPGDFTLSDANAMIQGRSLANYAEVMVTARLSASGQPTAQPGDWESQAVAVKPGDGATIALIIDREVQ